MSADNDTLAACQNDLHHIESMLHHMQDKLEAFVRDLEDGSGPDNLEEVRDFREGLVRTLIATGLERATIEDMLAEQRDHACGA